MATVTYRDIADAGQPDPIDFLFGNTKLYVAPSALTPELILRYYEELVKAIPVEELVAKSSDSPYGLESIQRLVSYEPRTPYHSFGEWRELCNNPIVMERALRGKVSHQMQYLPLWDFRLPSWDNAPHKAHPEYRACEVLLPLSSDALLVSRRQKLYFASAIWKPVAEYFWSKERKPDSVHIFTLSAFEIREVTWQDPCIMERIKNGAWNDCLSVAGHVALALRDTIDAANRKARWMSAVMGRVDFAHTGGVFHGR